MIIPRAIELLVKIAISNKGVELVEGEHYNGVIYKEKELDVCEVNVDLYNRKESQMLLYKCPFITNALIKNSFIKEHSIQFKYSLFEDQYFCYSIANIYKARLKHISKFFSIDTTRIVQHILLHLSIWSILF